MLTCPFCRRAELMAQIASEQAVGMNVVALLDMLAWSEGMDN